MKHTEALSHDLTPDEIAAPTYIEWSDETLAKMVRALAADIHDRTGSESVFAIAAVAYLINSLCKANGESFSATTTEGVTMRLTLEYPAKGVKP